MTLEKKTKSKKPTGPLHDLPKDFKQALDSKTSTKKAWDNLTLLAQNEWICWVTSAKKDATRAKRIIRAQEDLNAGKKRPCCWPGCPHRNPNTKKWFK